MSPQFPYRFSRGDAAFVVTNAVAGIYDITVTGAQVQLVRPGGGDYTMNIWGTGSHTLDAPQLEAEVIDRWRIVIDRSGHDADTIVPRR
ncbi:hypothetical protein GS896_27625 [Rhodococcus hoagii]|nr:hypothetical protein [Prescottella equi]MBM4654023.1 hypothetical protein [Prescottella equi]MBM4719716.1 hypothetical protein [Prescottella equi]NKR23511.1 hypothetical protein [Prescottella equi]NKT56335.1 hypothetical protein [Prescottella equi]